MKRNHRIVRIAAALYVSGTALVYAAPPAAGGEPGVPSTVAQPGQRIEPAPSTDRIAIPEHANPAKAEGSRFDQKVVPLPSTPGGKHQSSPAAPGINASAAVRAAAASVSPGVSRGGVPAPPTARGQGSTLTETDRTAVAGLLARDRTTLRKAPAVTPQRASAAAVDARIPRKMELGALPEPGAEAAPPCPKTQRLEELRGKVALGYERAAKKDRSPGEKSTDEAALDADRLALAGCLVGQGAWGEAREVLAELQETSTDPGILFAVGRNLEVVDKQLAVMGEKDPAKRSRLELELGQLHREFGHEKVARRILSAVSAEGATPEIRQRAAESLDSKAAPTRPPILPGMAARIRESAETQQGKGVAP